MKQYIYIYIYIYTCIYHIYIRVYPTLYTYLYRPNQHIPMHANEDVCVVNTPYLL